MQTQIFFTITAGQDKLTRYREEVKRAKLPHLSFRGRLAQLLRGWAQRLEPVPSSQRQLAESVH